MRIPGAGGTCRRDASPWELPRAARGSPGDPQATSSSTRVHRFTGDPDARVARRDARTRARVLEGAARPPRPPGRCGHPCPARRPRGLTSCGAVEQRPILAGAPAARGRPVPGDASATATARRRAALGGRPLGVGGSHGGRSARHHVGRPSRAGAPGGAAAAEQPAQRLRRGATDPAPRRRGRHPRADPAVVPGTGRRRRRPGGPERGHQVSDPHRGSATGPGVRRRPRGVGAPPAHPGCRGPACSTGARGIRRLVRTRVRGPRARGRVERAVARVGEPVARTARRQRPDRA